MRMANVQRTKICRTSDRRHLRSEVKGVFLKMCGTVGTVGILEEIVGKSDGFSECLTVPRGTVEMNAEVTQVVTSWFLVSRCVQVLKFLKALRVSRGILMFLSEQTR